jgi:hypothetical protein
MQGKTKIIIAIIIVLAVFYYVLPLFYETFNYSPSMDEGQPYRRSVLLWSALTNQRVTLNTEIPSIPVNKFPIYRGGPSSSVLNVSFTYSVEAYNNCTEELCFLIINNEIAESRLKSTDTLTDLQPVKLTDLNASGTYIIQQVRDRNFLTPEGHFPLLSLGRTRIVDVEFVYFNGFDTYPYRYIGKTTYYPAWKLTVETADYGTEVLMIKAF